MSGANGKSSDGRQPSGMRGRDGFLLITVLLVTVVVAILALGTSFTALTDRQVASRQRVGTEAYYLAQAGLDRLKTAVFLGLAASLNNIDRCGFDELVDIDLGGDLTLALGVDSAPIEDGTGYYVLRFDRSRGYYVLTSVGFLGLAEDRTAQATVQLVATAGAGPSGVWDNAIYAESLTPDSEGGIAGTVAAYGSVHIVNGDVVLESSESLVYTGTSGIFNNYNGRGNQTDASDVALRTLGESRWQPEDLCSRLKVAQGDVRVQSNATGIGAAGDTYDADGEWVEPAPGTQINSIEGVYLGTGRVVDQTGAPITSESQRRIYSRTGVSGYDGYALDDFPELHEDFPNDVEDGVVLLEGTCSLIVEGVLRLPPPAALGSVECGTGEHRVSWDEVTGQVEVMGNVLIPEATLVIAPRDGDGPAIDELVYSGTGQLRVGSQTNLGDIQIRMDVVPADADSNYVLDVANPIGLAFVTNGNILVESTGSGATVSALLYAEDTVQFKKQVAIVGAIVGRTVRTSQVPRVLYHPDVGAFAEFIGLPGTIAYSGGLGNEGAWSEVSTEVR